MPQVPATKETNTSADETLSTNGVPIHGLDSSLIGCGHRGESTYDTRDPQSPQFHATSQCDWPRAVQGTFTEQETRPTGS